MKATITKEQAVAGFHVLTAIAEAIRQVREVPAGVLYAQCMAQMSLEQFEKVIGLLIRAELVSRDVSHMLRWIGPQIDKAA